MYFLARFYFSPYPQLMLFRSCYSSHWRVLTKITNNWSSVLVFITIPVPTNINGITTKTRIKKQLFVIFVNTLQQQEQQEQKSID